MNDEELVRLFQNGDEEAGDRLLEKYKPLVLRFSRARFIPGGDRDDLIQEGMIGLYKAMRDFREGRGASFSTFAALCVDRQILRAIEASGREKNRALNDAVGFTGDEEEGRGFDVSPEQILIEREEEEERLRQLRSRLSPLESQVLDLFLDGMDYKEIAAKLGKSPKSVDNALQRIRKKG